MRKYKKKQPKNQGSTAMGQNKQLSLHFTNISRKKITADFTGGDVTSDVGVMAVREVADKIELIEQLAKAIHMDSHHLYMKPPTVVVGKWKTLSRNTKSHS